MLFKILLLCSFLTLLTKKTEAGCMEEKYWKNEGQTNSIVPFSHGHQPEACQDDCDCHDYGACLKGKCVNPCEGHCVQDNTVCYVTNHNPQCACLPYHMGDPSLGCKPVVVGANQKHPEGYDAADGRYFLYNIKVNWYEAMQLCAAKGLQGATFMTKEEYDRLVELMEDNGIGEYWVGGSDLGERDKYVWLPTGATFNYTIWDEPWHDHADCKWSHPECLREIEHCVKVYVRSNPAYEMNDHWCFYGLNYVACEIKNEV